MKSCHDDRVKPYDGLFRLLVRSSHDPQNEYLVDLEELGGNGKCGCVDFAVRKETALMENGGPDGDNFRCRHIRIARDWVGKRILDAVMQARAAEEKRLRLRTTI